MESRASEHDAQAWNSQPFGIRASGGSVEGILELTGEFDTVTAPALRASVEACLGFRPQRLVLDLAGIDFIDAAAVRVIVATSARLTKVGASLILRSPSPMTRRIFEICGLAELVALDGGPDATESSRPVRLPAVVDARDWQTRQAMVAAVLNLIVGLAQAAMVDVDGASISLELADGFVTAASSNETVESMDADQYATGEGPCLTAAREGRTVNVDSVADEKRWPVFIARARDRGINAVLSTPLELGTATKGALNVYSRSKGALAERNIDLAALFAGHASMVVGLSESSEVDHAQSSTDALRARTLIAQAQGVHMERGHISDSQAFTVLRRAARDADKTLVQEAAETVASTQRDRSTPVDEEP